MRLIAAIALALAAPASAQVLTVTVTDANTVVAGELTSNCWIAPHTLFCVCPGLASDYYGEPAPEIVHAPYASPSCTPNWAAGIWNTEFAVTSDGDIGVTQAVTNDVPFNEIVASFTFTGTGTKPPGTPLRPVGSFGTTLYIASQAIDFGCAEQEPTATGFIVTLRMVGDHDKSGEIAIPDIFAFLSDWFGQSARADADTDGAVVVPDIFTFLSAWFAGE